MKTTEIKIEKISHTTTFCDRCNKKIENRYGSKSCEMCGKDVCGECGHFYDRYDDLNFPSFTGDYPNIICHECWDIGEEQRLEIMQIRQEADGKEREQFEIWNKRCREKRCKCHIDGE